MSQSELILALAQLNPTAGDLKGNAEKALEAWQEARDGHADVIIFTEGYITGYFVADLVMKPAFLDDAYQTIERLAQQTKEGPDILIGGIRREPSTRKTRNTVFHLREGRIISYRDKVMLPNHDVYDEKRVMEAGAMPGPLSIKGFRLGVPICEDIWSPDIVECLAETGAELIVSINGSVFDESKHDERLAQASARIAESGLPLVYLNMVGGQDTVVFDGGSFALNHDYQLSMQLPPFFETIAFLKAVRKDNGTVSFEGGDIAPLPDRSSSLYQAAVLALRDYVHKSGFAKVVLGLSGGVDSALVATMAVDALGSENVHTVMLPYRFTSEASLNDAQICANRLGVSFETLAIEPLVEAGLGLLGDKLVGSAGDVAKENLQSRTRGLLLMTMANASGALLLTTGNKSEMATGYATLYGDMNGGFNPLKDLYKTQVFALCQWRNGLETTKNFGFASQVINPIPQAIIDKPPSAELREDQRDDDSLPPYDKLDAILSGLIERNLGVNDLIEEGHSQDDILKVQTLLYRAEFKRFQSAPGSKLSKKAFGLERRYPIVNKYQP